MGIRVVAYDGWDELDWPGKALEARYRVRALATLLGEKCVRRFRRKFFRYFDRRPKAQFMIWRGQRADELNADRVSIGKISQLLGFTDRSHFGRDHQRRHGVSALQRRRHEQEHSKRRGVLKTLYLWRIQA